MRSVVFLSAFALVCSCVLWIGGCMNRGEERPVVSPSPVSVGEVAELVLLFLRDRSGQCDSRKCLFTTTYGLINPSDEVHPQKIAGSLLAALYLDRENPTHSSIAFLISYPEVTMLATDDGLDAVVDRFESYYLVAKTDGTKDRRLTLCFDRTSASLCGDVKQTSSLDERNGVFAKSVRLTISFLKDVSRSEQQSQEKIWAR